MSVQEFPKIIHYCWFGGKPLPKSAKKCIDSWKRFFPDYEIKRWDESNFDINITPYTREAYKAGKYAFVSDYARFWILFKYGGIYFDTDVEVIKPFGTILNEGPFMGRELEYDPGMRESEINVAPGLGLGAFKGLPLYKEILDMYSRLSFEKEDGTLNLTTVVEYITNLLCSQGLQNSRGIQEVAGIKIYPSEFFCPKSVKDGKTRITSETRSIHHFDSSWIPKNRRILIKAGIKYPRLMRTVLIIKHLIDGTRPL